MAANNAQNQAPDWDEIDEEMWIEVSIFMSKYAIVLNFLAFFLCPLLREWNIRASRGRNKKREYIRRRGLIIPQSSSLAKSYGYAKALRYYSILG